MGSCRAWAPCERLRENKSVPVGVAGREHPALAIPDQHSRESGQQLDLTAPNLGARGGRLRRGQIRTGQRTVLPQGLKALAKRGV